MNNLIKIFVLGLVLVLMLNLTACQAPAEPQSKGIDMASLKTETVSTAPQTMSVDEYIMVTIPSSTGMSEALGEIGDLLQAKNIGTKSWEEDTASALGRIKIYSQNIIDLEGVPDEMLKVHTAHSMSAKEMIKFADKFALAYDDGMKIEDLEIAFAHMGLGTKFIQMATEYMEDYNKGKRQTRPIAWFFYVVI